MTKRKHAVALPASHSPLSNPLLSEIWSIITSDLGGLSSELAGAATSLAQQPTSTPATMTTTVDVTIPYSTVTVESTVTKTSFVTITSSSTPSSLSTTLLPSTSPTSTLLPEISSSIPSISSLSSRTSLPFVVTQSSQPSLSFTFVPSTHSTTLPGSTTSSIGGVQATSTASSSSISSQSQSQKHAIIGGLAGAIAGLVLIGLVICLILRYRRQRMDGDEASLNEKGASPSFLPKVAAWANGRSHHKPVSHSVEHHSPAPVDEDQNIIRMDTQHWPRPFATGEGWRDSVPPGQLRVTNPDSSRPGTPRRSSETVAGAFLRRSRSELNRAFPGVRLSRNSSPQRPAPVHEVPQIRVDPVISRQIPPWRAPPSFKSYPSISSLSVIRQHPLEDPFLTPSYQSNHPGTQPPLQATTSPAPPSPVQRAGRTLRHWGSYLNPFRSRPLPPRPSPDPETNIRAVSHFSTSTRSSRPSRRSDPFDLDRPSWRSSLRPSRIAAELARRGRSPNWILYEGT